MIRGLKPYSTYKDSRVPWMGEVPRHWNVSRVRHVSLCLDGKRVPLNGSERERRKGIYPYWGANRIIDHVNDWLFDEPLVLLGEDGAPFFERNRDVAFFVMGKIWVNNHAHVLRPRAIAGQYLVAALNSVDYSAFIDGSTRDKLTQQAMKDIPIPLPAEQEQTSILRFLDHIDRRIRRYIRAKQKLIALLNEEKQAIIQRAVTRGIDSSVAFKPSGVDWLGDVPEHWKIRRAKFFVYEVDERSTTGTEELLSVSHITGVSPRSQKNVTMFMAVSNVGHKLCRAGDLAVNTMWAWMGALGISRYTGIVSPSYAVYRPLRNSGLLPDYADLLLRTRPYIDEYVCRSTGIRSSRLRLYPEQFLQIWLLCPPREEQLAIVRWVDHSTSAANAAIVAAQREIDLLREYRARLVADVVTGKLDVREAAAQLPEEPAEAEPPEEMEPLDEHENAELEAAAEEADA